MDILIEGALPPPVAAQQIIKQFPTQSYFFNLLASHRAQCHTFDVDEIACLPSEYYQLQQHHFTTRLGQRTGAGLNALQYAHTSQPKEPYYKLEFCHLLIDPQNTRIVPAQQLQIDQTQSLALFESVKYFFAQQKIKLLHVDETGWIIAFANPEIHYDCPSAALVAYLPVHNHWPSDAQHQQLRRFLNEIQMLWHEHPVNQARQEKGLLEINSMWLYGGASYDQITPQATSSYCLVSTLSQAHCDQDWGSWLQNIPALDQTLQAMPVDKNTRYILCGFDRMVILKPFGLFERFNPKLKQQWKTWWTQSSSQPDHVMKTLIKH